MKAIILHLSDLHLKATGNAIFDKLDKIHGAVNVHGEVFQAGFIAFSGDIAFSGKLEEYDLAKDLIEKLRASLKGAGGITQWHTVFTPGNHDCDFIADDE